jgi:uncharacterized membrane protein YvlD (DUF360 family)
MGGVIDGFVFRFLIGAAGLAFAVLIVPGLEVRDPPALFVAALSVGLATACLRPAVTRFLPPPPAPAFGLLLMLTDAAVIGLTSGALDGFVLHGLWAATATAVVAGLTGWIADGAVR